MMYMPFEIFCIKVNFEDEEGVKKIVSPRIENPDYALGFDSKCSTRSFE